jgi:steroid delta-isomerase-like uncharacterized protein
MDEENRHDTDGTLSTFSSKSARYDIPCFGDGGQVAGHDNVRALYEGLFAAFPDFHVEAGPMRHGDDHVLVEVRLSGTHHDDWVGIPNQGCSINTRAATIFDFDGDQMVCERVYMDFGEIARQPGAA